MSDDLVAFLTARLDEDEAAAKAVQLRFPGPWDQAEATGSTLHEAVTLYDARDESVGIIRGSYAAGYLARHDPARVLREVAAKRAIIADCEAKLRYPANKPLYNLAMRALGNLAGIWADHPDYRPEWKP